MAPIGFFTAPVRTLTFMSYDGFNFILLRLDVL